MFPVNKTISYMSLNSFLSLKSNSFQVQYMKMNTHLNINGKDTSIFKYTCIILLPYHFLWQNTDQYLICLHFIYTVFENKDKVQCLWFCLSKSLRYPKFCSLNIFPIIFTELYPFDCKPIYSDRQYCLLFISFHWVYLFFTSMKY